MAVDHDTWTWVVRRLFGSIEQRWRAHRPGRDGTAVGPAAPVRRTGAATPEPARKVARWMG